jgi:C-terminal processing protease CtpA/Prc
MNRLPLLSPLLCSVMLLLAGCGGDGPAAGVPASRSTSAAARTAAASSLPPSAAVMDKCVAPRTGADPTGFPYPDRQGTLDDELAFLRHWTDETYLWYAEIPATVRQEDFRDTAGYFAALKTPLLTPAGKPKDRYHFTYPSDRWERMSNGVELGYGITWVGNGGGVPRSWRVAHVQPGSAAEALGVARGDLLLAIDGIDFIHAGGTDDVARINAGLAPLAEGERHVLRIQHLGFARDLELAATPVQLAPVQNVTVIEQGRRRVGYMTFSRFDNPSEKALAEAIAHFRERRVTDLVLDMRYNGGGLVQVAGELAYMIAGPGPTAGRVFERLLASDRREEPDPILFDGKAYGFGGAQGLPRGTALPSLDLRRVAVLAGPGTCSASEALVNGLRGVGIEVILVGATTCGKPHAFNPMPNCGTTYFAIQFHGVNDRGDGDYDDGFAPTCPADENFLRPLGHVEENKLATALRYLETGRCDSAGTAGRSAARAPDPALRPMRSPASEISVVTPRR